MPPSPLKKQKTSAFCVSSCAPSFEKDGQDEALYVQFKECTVERVEARLWDDIKDEGIMHVREVPKWRRSSKQDVPCWLVTKDTTLGNEWVYGIDLKPYFREVSKEVASWVPEMWVRWLVMQYYLPYNAFSRKPIFIKDTETASWWQVKEDAQRWKGE